MSSTQDVYAVNLRQSYGYPLHSPAPRSGLGEPYNKEGLQIGDVGYVNSLGEFDVLFNIAFPDSDKDCSCDPQPSLKVPYGQAGQPRMNHLVLPERRVFMTGVEQNVDKPRYTNYISVDVLKI